MLVCCSGMARSGSTWSYNVCRRIAEATGLPTVAGFYGEGDALDAYIEDRHLTEFPGHVVLKLHQPGPVLLELILQGAATNIYTIRDPRDCLCSRMRFENRAFDDSLLAVVGNLLMYNCYETAGGSLFVNYDTMMADPRAQIARIADHMGVALDRDRIAEVDADTGLERSRAVMRDLEAGGIAAAREIAGRLVDPRTCLQTGHIGHGRTGQWRDGLSEAESLTATAVLRDWLVRLEYERADDVDGRIAAYLGPVATAEAASP